MARTVGKLTALAARNAPTGKHFDGDGLYLEVTSGGSRTWRLKFRHAGRESRATFGRFPEVGLSEARARAQAARAQLRDGVSPTQAKREKLIVAKRAAEASFAKVALRWLESMQAQWAPATFRKAKFVVDSYLIPKLARESIETLSTPQAKAALDGMPVSLAHKARGYLNNIVQYAILTGLRDEGRLLSLRGAIPRAVKGHIPAAVSIEDVRQVARAVRSYPIATTRAALTIAMLTGQRPGNVVSMQWSEVWLPRAEWIIPPSKLKTRHTHIVPLSQQAVEVLRSMRKYTQGERYVFPALYRQQTPHLHRDSLSNALRKLGLQGKHATHGFRGMLRTVGRERLGISADVLEAQLAHAKKGDVQKAYDRTQLLEERRIAMQSWADYLDKSEDASAQSQAQG